MPVRHKGRCLPPSRAWAVPSTQAAPLPCAPPRPHALHPSCVHTGSAGGTGVRAMGGPRRGGHASGEGRTQGVHARRGHASGEDCTQGVRARRGGARNDGRCNPGSKRRRREGCANRARRNLGEGCCARAEGGCENEAEGSGLLPGAGKGGGCASGGGVRPGGGAARERKAARTVSAPPRPVDRLVPNPVTYLANKIEFLLLVNE